MHGPGRQAPPPAGPPGTLRVGPGSSPADLERAAGLLSADPFSSGTDSVPQPGPEFYASYGSECSAAVCLEGGDIEEGDLIQADGEGGYAHSGCLDD